MKNQSTSIPLMKEYNYRFRSAKGLRIEAPKNISQEKLNFRNRKSVSNDSQKENDNLFVQSIEDLISDSNSAGLFLKLKENSNKISNLNQQKINMIFDIFNLNVSIKEAFETTKLLISSCQERVSKYSIKSFFFICGKVKKPELAKEIIEYIEKVNGASVQNESQENPLYIAKQYYIFSLMKSDEKEEAFNQYEQMRGNSKKGMDKVILKSAEFLFKECIKSKDFFQAKEIIRGFYGKDLETSEIYFNKLIDFASKNDSLEICEFVLLEMNKLNILPSLVTYNTLLDSYIRSNMVEQAWILFEQLKKTENTPDRFTFTTMINCIKKSPVIELQKAFELLEEYKVSSVPDRVIYNCLLDVCVSANDFEKAEEVLNEMKTMGNLFRLDDISFNILIKASCKAKNLKKAVSFFEDMKSEGISPTIITYNSLLDTFVKAGKMDIVWKLYDAMLNDNIKADPYTYSILINGIKSTSKKEDITKIDSLYQNLIKQPEFKYDQVIYNSIIDAYVGFSDFNRAFQVFQEMKKVGIKPTTITFNILIKGYGLSNQLDMAFNIFKEMEKYGIKKNEITFGCLIEACVKNHQIEKAYKILEEMKETGFSENSIQITSIIKGLSRMGKHKDAIALANEMMNDSFENKKRLNLISYNCLIDVFIRGGEFKLAMKLFKLLQKEHKPDLITYSTLIKGALIQKNYKQSSELFNEMLDKNIKPDDVLFNMILDFCVSNKLYEQGLKLFESLIAHNLNPSERTFGLILKIYGQTKRYQEAYKVLDVMKNMKVKPSLITYTSLLQICINERRGEKIDEIFNHLLDDKIKLDSIVFNKLILGSLRCGKIDLAVKYYMFSREMSIDVDKDCLGKFTDNLTRAKHPNAKRVILLINTPPSKTAISKEPASIDSSRLNSEKENRNMNIPMESRLKEGLKKREVRAFNPF